MLFKLNHFLIRFLNKRLSAKNAQGYYINTSISYCQSISFKCSICFLFYMSSCYDRESQSDDLFSRSTGWLPYRVMEHRESKTWLEYILIHIILFIVRYFFVVCVQFSKSAVSTNSLSVNILYDWCKFCFTKLLTLILISFFVRDFTFLP